MSKSDLVREWREQAEREGAKVYTPKPITAEEMEALLREQDEAARGASTVYDFPGIEMTPEEWDAMLDAIQRMGVLPWRKSE